jgi:Uma2 family endonuclease
MIAEVHNDRYGVPKYAGQTMKKADFLRWESDDNYVYEFNNGVLEPTTSMKQEEVHILNAIENHFFTTNAFREGGRLRAEVDVWVSDRQMRRPDVLFFTKVQFEKMAAGENTVPTFVAELVSENDDARKYIKKLHEYFQAGVQVVWLIFPDDYTVYVYTSPKTVTICTDDDTLSAAPALPELQMTVAELFRR